MRAFQIENCAAWNDKQSLRAYRLGEQSRAKRLELQAFRLWVWAHELRIIESESSLFAMAA